VGERVGRHVTEHENKRVQGKVTHPQENLKNAGKS